MILPSHFRNLVLAVCSTLFFSNAFAQNTDVESKHAIKFYNVSSYAVRNTETIDFNNNVTTLHRLKSLQILKPSIGFQWKTEKRRLNELALNDYYLVRRESITEVLNPQQTIVASGGIHREFRLALGYEHSRPLLKVKDKKWDPYFGFAINTALRTSRFAPFVNNIFPSNNQRLETFVAFVPKVQYNVSKKVFLDINIPVNMMRVSLQRDKSFDLIANNYLRYNSEVTILPTIYSLKIGLGLNI